LHRKKYEIRDHTPDFHIKFRSTLSFFCRIIYKRIFDIENKLDEGMFPFGARQTVNLPCAGGGSVSSETGWDGRKKDEEDENFRLRCWLHAAKTVRASQYVPTKRKGYGL